MSRRLTAGAAAKVNLTLRILGRRADGYHELESLVVFAGCGDRLTLEPGPRLTLTVEGPTGAEAGPSQDNLVLRAARALAVECGGSIDFGDFVLTKMLPVAAGLGGGSADAAAALRLLAAANGLAPADPRLFAAARRTGADVPVCLDPRPRVMRGIGDILSAPLDLPPLPAVLVNPGVAVPTREVFSALALEPGESRLAGEPLAIAGGGVVSPAAAVAAIERHGNDLEAPAIAIAPAIADVLARLRGAGDCLLARMSGSGATCFALFASAQAAAEAARRIETDRPGWWVRATTFGAG